MSKRMTVADLPVMYRKQLEAAYVAQAKKKLAATEDSSVAQKPTIRQKRGGPSKLEACVWGSLSSRCIEELKFHPLRKWRFDFAWIDSRVALEVEGGVWSSGRHVRGSGFVADMEKYNAAAELGWRVVRCVPKCVNSLATVQMVTTVMKWNIQNSNRE